MMIQPRTLRAGVFLPPLHPNDEDPLLCMERDFQLMRWLDAHDYAEPWIGEHHSGGYEIYGQPELFIATAAERARRKAAAGSAVERHFAAEEQKRRGPEAAK